MKVVSIVGARPQFVKLAVVSKALRLEHDELILHTGQHYDYNMSAHFFDALAIPTPDYHLDIGSGPHGAQSGRMLEAIEQVLIQEQPDWVIVYGDTNSTLAGALAAAKLHMPVAHVEAGLRSYNRAMPEEINRVVTDHLSDLLFCPTETARRQANAEGLVQGVEVVGDVMYDMLLQVQPLLDTCVQKLLPIFGLQAKGYVLVTVHRAANTDDPATLRALADAFNRLEMPILFPVHPRTRACLERLNIQWKQHVHLIDPVGYVEMLALERAAYRILTDSGGIQKEAFFLGVPCVTLREETEWPETVRAGWNILVGSNQEAIRAAVNQPTSPEPTINPFGTGDAAVRITQCLSRQNYLKPGGV